jgi:hypothetical protein
MAGADRRIDSGAFEALFEGADERTRRRAFCELVRQSCDLLGVALWMRVAGTTPWCTAARSGRADEEREVLAVNSLCAGRGSLGELVGECGATAARGPYGAADSPWYLSLVGPFDPELDDVVDALAAVWEHVRIEDTVALDDLDGPHRARRAA